MHSPEQAQVVAKRDELQIALSDHEERGHRIDRVILCGDVILALRVAVAYSGVNINVINGRRRKPGEL